VMGRLILGHRDGAAGDPWMGGQKARFVEHGRLLGFGASKIGPVTARA
jgi:hypothetical protein